jgi:hypothetical protein
MAVLRENFMIGVYTNARLETLRHEISKSTRWLGSAGPARFEVVR